MSLAGICLESNKDENWATRLSTAEARLAAEFATLEVNGFPKWLDDLAVRQPDAVGQVIYGEIRHELSLKGSEHFQTLQSIAFSEKLLSRLISPALLADLEAGWMPAIQALHLALRVIVQGLLPNLQERFIQWCTAKFEEQPQSSTGITCLSAAYAVDPHSATACFVRTISEMEEMVQAGVVDQFLAKCFSSSNQGSWFKESAIPSFGDLSQLNSISMKTWNLTKSSNHEPGVVFVPDQGDFADEGRNALFNLFANTPGLPTYQALRLLMKDPSCPVAPSRLRELAERRAVLDGESEAWRPQDTFQYEKNWELAPRTPEALQSLLLARIEDIQHELTDGDFSQAQTLRSYTLEREVQIWLGDRFQTKSAQSYTVRRESHVADEKEPDILITAMGSEARVAIEIKIVESWTLPELDTALEKQLCGQYLRSNQGRHGIFLMVRQGGKTWWHDKPQKRRLSFAKLIERLQARAFAISGEAYDAPQPLVAFLDVAPKK